MALDKVNCIAMAHEQGISLKMLKAGVGFWKVGRLNVLVIES